jgi:hypothetical protein
MPLLSSHGITQRSRKKYKIDNSKINLFYLGNGSYGTIYEIIGTNIALKEHRITSIYTDYLCDNWKKEYDIQLAVYKKRNKLLFKYFINIVKPFDFSYATRNNNNKLISQKNIEGATSCYYTMDRVPGMASSNKCFINKLYKLIKPNINFPSAEIPPYLFLGTLNQIRGHISLDMLIGVDVIQFPNDAINYCVISKDSIGLQLIQNMFISFFIIAESGYMPRDIEYVFNGSCNNIYCSILDFNEVMTISDRVEAYGKNYSYKVEIDIAHVYIDLCGLRSSRDVNPYAPYDSPTPQWKFLCNPIVSPYAFFECVNFSYKNHKFKTFKILEVINEILSYVEKRIFTPLFNRIFVKFSNIWKPSMIDFSVGCELDFSDFDRQLQMYYIYSLLDTCEKRKIIISTNEISGKSYKDLLMYLLDKLMLSNVYINDDWEFPFDGMYINESDTKDNDNNITFTIKPRRYTLRRHK